ncbi:uncharacterized protein LOC108717260 [Xenopus laevis]|uniref:Uncharacterized protein LOC108717260 n=2 Tax=Xenopus laevis TaxID=8355 RepID=A0A1L8GCM5_XENLA|nr:uncharacterized protein LOC108717260 [Xenopus laevis]OCT81474.1 hypothetical protein XELAEV_18028294mg [Xenopus laevis]
MEENMELEPLANGSAARPPDPKLTETPLARDAEKGGETKSQTRYRQICQGKKKWLWGFISGMSIIILIVLICVYSINNDTAGAQTQKENGPVPDKGPVPVEVTVAAEGAVPDGVTVAAEGAVPDGVTAAAEDNETAGDCERLVYVSANNSDGSFQSSYDSCASKGYELLKEPDIEVRKHCIPQGEDFWIHGRRDCEPCPVYNTHDGVLRLDSTTMRRFFCDPQAPEPTDGQI